MRKFLLGFLSLFIASNLHAKADVNIPPLLLLKTTATVIAPWTFLSSTTFVSPLMSIFGVPYNWPNANAAGCFKNDGSGNISFGACGSGGGGGGGSGVYIGPPYNVTVSTIMFPEFNVLSDGNGASTVTVRNSTGTWVTQTFSSAAFTIGAGLADGIKTAPSLWWGNARGSGFYNASPGSADLRYATAGNDVLLLNSRVTATDGFTGSQGTPGAPTFAYGTSGNSGLYLDASLTQGISSRGTRIFYGDTFGHIILGPNFPFNQNTVGTVEIVHFSGTDYTQPLLVVDSGPTSVLASGPKIPYFYVGRDTVGANVQVVASSGITIGSGYGLNQSSGVQIGGVQLTTYMSTVTTAINSMSGGSSGGSGFRLGPPWNVNVGTAIFPNTDFNVRSDGVGTSSFTWRDSTGIITASQIFVGSNVFIRINQTPIALDPTVQQFTYGQGDNSTFKGVLGIQSIVADYPGTVVGNKGVLYGAEFEVQPSVDRNNVPFDDAVPLVLANGGTGKGTDALYISKNPTFANSSQWLTSLVMDANSDVGLKQNASFYFGIQMDASTYTIAPIALPWNSYIVAKSKADASYKNLIGYNLKEQVSLRNDAITIDASSHVNIINLSVPYGLTASTASVSSMTATFFVSTGIGNGGFLGNSSTMNVSYINQSVQVSSFLYVNPNNTGNIGISSPTPQFPFTFTPSTYSGVTGFLTNNLNKTMVLSYFAYTQKQRPTAAGGLAGVNSGFTFDIRDEPVDADKGFDITNVFNGVLCTTNPPSALPNFAAGSNGRVGSFIHTYGGMADHPFIGVLTLGANRTGNGNVSHMEALNLSITDSATGGSVLNSFAQTISRPVISALSNYNGLHGGIDIATQIAAAGIQTSTPIALYSEGKNDIGFLVAGRSGIGVTNPNYSLAIATEPAFINVGVSTGGYIFAASSAAVHTLSSCGTNPSVRGGGSVFTVTPGGGAPGACTITFANGGFTQPPHAIVTPQNGSVLNTFSYTQPTQTGMTVTETGLGTFTVMLFGQN